MGPIGVAAHLAPYLPGHPLIETGGDRAIHALAAAPWSSASILLISYAYMKLLGGDGMTEATRYAILNANYLKSRLEPYYPVLYTRENIKPLLGVLQRVLTPDGEIWLSDPKRATANEFLPIAKKLWSVRSRQEGPASPTVSRRTSTAVAPMGCRRTVKTGG